jgi:hypothetical protein
MDLKKLSSVVMFYLQFTETIFNFGKLKHKIMKNQSLLRRFRWPLFILLWGAAQFSGTMFLYGQTKEAGIGFMIALGIMCIAVVLNTIDETEKEIQ